MPTLLDLPITFDAADLLYGVGSCHAESGRDEHGSVRTQSANQRLRVVSGTMRRELAGMGWRAVMCPAMLVASSRTAAGQ